MSQIDVSLKVTRRHEDLDPTHQDEHGPRVVTEVRLEGAGDGYEATLSIPGHSPLAGYHIGERYVLHLEPAPQEDQ